MSREPEAPLRGPAVLAVETHGDLSVLRLNGELDLYNAGEIRDAVERLIADGAKRIVVDLSQVEFLDSTVLGVMIEARAHLGRDGLLLAQPGAEVKRAIVVSGIDRHLRVHETVAEALEG